LKQEAEEVVSLDCSRCGNEIGKYVKVEGQEFLQVGGILSREAHGVCIQCGREFHWSVPDRKLGKLFIESRGKG